MLRSRQFQSPTGENGNVMPEGLMRKTTSLDFALYSQSLDAKSCQSPDCMASRFGRHEQEGRYSFQHFRRRSSSRLPALLHSSESLDDGGDSENNSATRPRNLVMKIVSRRIFFMYLSVFLLGLATASNFVLATVEAQMHRIESVGTIKARPRLGTAAISSLTDTLSPILPFTGGLDLRREWEFRHSLTYVVDQVRDSFGPSSIPRGGGQAPEQHSIKLTTSGSLKKVKTKHVSSLSASTPFVRVDEIETMTLADLTQLFRHALDSNREGHDKKKFLRNSIDSRLHSIITKIDAAIATSRGKNVEPAKTLAREHESNGPLSPAVGYGDIDALQFCAAMRLFAEWRVLRQVPEGFKGYAVGMNLGHKDIVQNVAKIERAVHEWLDHRRGLLELQATWNQENDIAHDESDNELRSPTLRDLLEHERDMETHGNNRLPRLKDKTAAMGLLWVRRQLHYQTSVFGNIIQVPEGYSTTIDAVSAAYSEVYGKYHGWAVQKIFNYSFQAAPDVKEIFKYMNPHRLQQVMEEASFLSPSQDDDTVNAEDDEEESSDEEKDQERAKSDNMNPLEQFGNHIAREWDKFVGHLFGGGNKRGIDVRGGGGKASKGLLNAELEAFVNQKMSEQAEKEIVVYLGVVQPLLRDVAGLFSELNMDDPSKV